MTGMHDRLSQIHDQRFVRAPRAADIVTLKGEPIRVLLAEDVRTDAELAVRELKRAGLRVNWRIADNEETFRAALANFEPHIILSDFSMPSFDGMAALHLARELAPHVPFLFVSGTLGEEYAIRALKNGATDYVLKTNLIRLPAAVDRALSEASERASKREMQAHLDDMRERMRAIFETLPDAVWSIALPGEQLIYMSPAARAVLGHAAEDFAADVELRRRIVHPDDHAGMLQAWASLREGTPYEIEYRIVLPDGRTRWIDERAHRVCGPDGAPLRVDGIARDITDQVAQRERLARLARIRELLGATNAAIVRLRGRNELFAEFCRIAVDIGGFLGGRVVEFEPGTGQLRVAVATNGHDSIAQVVDAYNRDPENSQTLLAQALRTRQAQASNDVATDSRVLLGAQHPDGVRSIACFPLEVGKRVEGALVVVAAEKGVFDDAEVGLLAELASNLSLALERNQQREQIDYLAYYDPLTGLPNRKLFYERLDQALVGARDTDKKVALMIFDVERFKTINETFSMAAGDRVLQDFARRLTELARERFGLGRLGANEFGLLLPQVSDSGEVGRLLDSEVAALLDTIITFEGHELRVAARAGIAMSPEDGADADTLLRNGEAAMMKAKAGAERYVFYAPSLNARVAERLVLESKLRRAVDRNEFTLHFQPKVDLADRRVTGVEALLRWPGASGPMASPAAFVPVLEETGFIDQVGLSMMRVAVATHRDWRARGLPAPRIAVNVSTGQLRSRSFVDDVREIVAGEGEASGLDLEITETVLMENIEESREKLRQLRELGLHIALDDFGTGYCSLGYLSRLPIDTLKIDRSFIHAMTEKPDDASIVSAMISLGKALNLTIVAEGVETEEQARLLKLLRCHQFQGYLFSKPVAREQLEALLVQVTA